MWRPFKGLAWAALLALAVAVSGAASCRPRGAEARNGAEVRPLPPQGGGGAQPRKGRLPPRRKAQEPKQGNEGEGPGGEPSQGPPGDDRAPPARPPDESEKAVA